jgi:hypothetical protein
LDLVPGLGEHSYIRSNADENDANPNNARQPNM